MKVTGLGMAIVKSLIEAHEGMIEVDSRLKEGTKFTITLPLLTSCQQKINNYKNTI